MASEKIDIHTTLLSEISYSFFRVLLSIQQVLSTLYWWLFIRSLFFVFKNQKAGIVDSVQIFRTKGGHTSNSSHTADYTVWHNRWGHKYLKVALRFYSLISGVRSFDGAFEAFLAAEPHFRIIGFEAGKVVQTLEILGKPKDVGGQQAHPWDLIWFSRPKPTGTIQILKKVYNESNKEIEVSACWLSGPNVGKIFHVTSRTNWLASSADTRLPSHVFLPSGVVVTSIKLIVGSGAIITALTPWAPIFDQVKVWLFSFFE